MMGMLLPVSKERARRPRSYNLRMTQAPTEPVPGGCLCGRIRFEVRGPFGPVANCHCSMCRKAQGGGFATLEDDGWGGTECVIELADGVEPDALTGLEAFSHVE